MVTTATRLTAVLRAVAPLVGSDVAPRSPQRPAREHVLAGEDTAPA